MSDLLNYFDSAYLINLPDRKDRLRSATRILARAGWTLGPNGIELYAARKFTDRAGFPGSPSVRGCFHSHSECIRMASKLGKNSVLLIEDDIALSPAIRHLAPAIVRQLELLPWDFAYLGHEFTGDVERATSRTAEVKFVPISAEIRALHLYAVHRRIFTRLLAHLDRVATGRAGDQEFGPMPIDGAYNIFRRLNSDVHAFIAVPKLGWQRPSRSDITPRSFDNVRSLRPVITTLRNLKHAVDQWFSF